MGIRPPLQARSKIQITIPFLIREERIFWVPQVESLWKMLLILGGPLLFPACLTLLQDKESFPQKELPDAHEPGPAFIGLDCFPCDHELFHGISFLHAGNPCRHMHTSMANG